MEREKLKLVDLKDNLFREGEYLVGFEQTGTHACYFLYGFLKPGEERDISPGNGHVEIVCLLEGEIELVTDNEKLNLTKGKGFVIEGEEKVKVKNIGDKVAVYVVSGGHVDPSHH